MGSTSGYCLVVFIIILVLMVPLIYRDIHLLNIIYNVISVKQVKLS